MEEHMIWRVERGMREMALEMAVADGWSMWWGEWGLVLEVMGLWRGRAGWGEGV
jgi:hypothetical protein